MPSSCVSQMDRQSLHDCLWHSHVAKGEKIEPQSAK